MKGVLAILVKSENLDCKKIGVRKFSFVNQHYSEVLGNDALICSSCPKESCSFASQFQITVLIYFSIVYPVFQEKWN